MVTSSWKKIGRVHNFVSKLFEDDRKDYNPMKRNFAWPPIMKDETWAAIKKIKFDLLLFFCFAHDQKQLN